MVHNTVQLAWTTCMWIDCYNVTSIPDNCSILWPFKRQKTKEYSYKILKWVLFHRYYEFWIDKESCEFVLMQWYIVQMKNWQTTFIVKVIRIKIKQRWRRRIKNKYSNSAWKVYVVVPRTMELNRKLVLSVPLSSPKTHDSTIKMNRLHP